MLGLKRKPASKFSSTEVALAEARTALEASMKRLDESGERYRLAVNAEDREAAVAARNDESSAALERDLAAARVQRLEKELTDARAAEAEAERRVRYETARTARDAAADRLRADYPRLARELAGLLAEIEASAHAVAAANADKPAETPDLLPAETVVRDRAGVPEKIIKRETVEEWAFTDGGQRVGDARGYRLPQSGDSGVLVPPGGGRTIPVVKRSFIKVGFIPAASPRFADPLATTLRLPGLRVDDPSIYPPDPGVGGADADPVAEIRYEPA